MASALSPTAAARNVMRDYLVDENNQLSLPVDPIELAKAMGIDVSIAPLADNVAGLIVKESKESQVQIMLNSKDLEARQRFTCAHEVGHYVKRSNDNEDGLIGFIDYRNEMSGRGVDPEEVWANRFAAELLMPSFAVRQYWAEGESISKLAKLFDVSRAAMEVRVASLRLA
ncbi:ImmA/IrrE family metallo-endopeptidase [Arthrobacter psychrolactophilus]